MYFTSGKPQENLKSGLVEPENEKQECNRLLRSYRAMLERCAVEADLIAATKLALGTMIVLYPPTLPRSLIAIKPRPLSTTLPRPLTIALPCTSTAIPSNNYSSRSRVR